MEQEKILLLAQTKKFSVRNMMSKNEASRRAPEITFPVHGVCSVLSQDLIHHLLLREDIH